MADREVLTLNKETPQIVLNKSGDNYKFPNLITIDPVTADVIWENNGVLNINGGAASVDPNYVGQDTAPAPSATGTDSLAMGPGANAGGVNAISIGPNSTASNNGDIVIGLNASATNLDAVVIGTDASGTQRDGVALGLRASADRESVAIGPDSLADVRAGVAIGLRADAGTRDNNIALGTDASAQGEFAISIGLNTVSVGENGIAMGESASSPGEDGLSIGKESISTGLTSVGLGRNARSLSNQSTAVGGSSLARFKATSIGNNSLAEGQRSIGLGHIANAASNEGMAFGFLSFSENIGEITYATGESSSAGEFKYSTYICRGSTVNANPLIINPDGGTTNRMILLPETFWGFEIDLSAFETTSPFDGKYIKFQGAIRRDASNNTILIGSITTTIIAASGGATAWVAAITANDTDEALQIQVTGEVATQLNWVAVVRISGTRDV